ncbi:MAG: hypothetical protein AAF721_04020 [Myxococcota bacterium]
MGDVKVVQRLLNKHGPGHGGDLTVDGASGPRTVGAIEHFQREVVKMRAPDRRVDPGGKTIRMLNRGPTAKSDRSRPPAPGEPAPRRGGRAPSRSRGANGGADSLSPKPTSSAGRQEQRERRRKFVRPAVKEIAVTTKIIDRIMPKFDGIRATVISGFLGDSDRFWKINYHWEYLLWMLDHCRGLDVEARDKRALEAISSQLRAKPPQPDTGYRTSGRVGHPVDKSSMRDMDERVKLLRQAKRDFKAVTRRAGLKSKSKRSPKSFDLAAAPVAHPGSSKHGTGYALDIEGNNAQIKATAKGLGATVVFDEQSHVHVEFKNMV